MIGCTPIIKARPISNVMDTLRHQATIETEQQPNESRENIRYTDIISLIRHVNEQRTAGKIHFH